MPTFNLSHGVVDAIVGFGSTPLPLTAHTVVRYEDGKVEPQTYTVVGFAVVHRLDADGAVVETSLRPAIWSAEYSEAIAVDEAFGPSLGASNEKLVGVYPTELQATPAHPAAHGGHRRCQPDTCPYIDALERLDWDSPLGALDLVLGTGGQA